MLWCWGRLISLVCFLFGDLLAHVWPNCDWYAFGLLEVKSKRYNCLFKKDSFFNTFWFDSSFAWCCILVAMFVLKVEALGKHMAENEEEISVPDLWNAKFLGFCTCWMCWHVLLIGCVCEMGRPFVRGYWWYEIFQTLISELTLIGSSVSSRNEGSRPMFVPGGNDKDAYVLRRKRQGSQVLAGEGSVKMGTVVGIRLLISFCNYLAFLTQPQQAVWYLLTRSCLALEGQAWPSRRNSTQHSAQSARLKIKHWKALPRSCRAK